MSKEKLMVLLKSSETPSLPASQSVDLKMSIALTAVRTMLKSDRFDVCTVRNVCEIIGANASGTAFEMLRALHCLRYSEMSRDVQAGIPDLMREVFSQVKIDDDAIQGIFKGVRA